MEKVVASDPTNQNAWLMLGNLYFDTSKHSDAIKAYQKYLELNPNNANVWTDLGVMYRRNGQSDEAVRRFRMAMDADPMHFQSRMNMGVVLLYDFNDTAGAREAANSVLAIYPQGPQADNARQLLATIDAAGGQ